MAELVSIQSTNNQAPNPKQIPKTKFKMSKTAAPHQHCDFKNWCLFGTWFLVLGHFR